MLTKNEITALNLSPTKKDFVQIWNELLEVAGRLSERWDPTSTNESDPGIVILKALAGIADKLNYNIDKNTLEAFMPTAAQEDSMRKLCDMLGYNIKYYRSAETTVTFKYHNSEPSEDEENAINAGLLIPKFTVITNGDQDINYFTTNQVPYYISATTPYTEAIPCMEGQIVKCESTTDNNVITINQITDNNRFYLPEHQIAENGLFVYNVAANQEDGDIWEKVDNLNIQTRGSRVFKFGYDSYEGRPYIEFPADYSELFNDGLFIYYARTSGANGNISARALTQFEAPSLAGWSNVSLESFSVENAFSATTGANIETISQAYNNFKKTIGTFETLVTCRDYMNKIYTMTADGTNKHLVSNILATDIRTDLNRAITICSCDDAGIFYKDTPLVQTEVRTLKRPAPSTEMVEVEDEVPLIDHFDLVLYPFKSYNQIKNNVKDVQAVYDRSFEYSTSDFNTIKNRLDQSAIKTIAHNIVPPQATDIVSINNYLKLNAIIGTTSKVTTEEGDLLKEKIKIALANAFNMRELDFGEEIPFDSIMSVIVNADPRISVVSLAEPALYTTFSVFEGNNAYNNPILREYAVASDWLTSDYANSSDRFEYTNDNSAEKYTYTFDTAEAKKIYNKLAVRNVLAGRVPLFKYNTTFTNSFSDGAYRVTEVITTKPECLTEPTEDAPYTIYTENNIVYTGQWSDQGITYKQTYTPPAYADNIISAGNDTNITKIVTNCKVKSDLDANGQPTYSISNVALADGEYIKFRAPNFTTDKTYPAYVNYHLVLNNKQISEATPAEAVSLDSLLNTESSRDSLFNHFNNSPSKKSFTMTQKIFGKSESDQLSDDITVEIPNQDSVLNLADILDQSGFVKLVSGKATLRDNDGAPLTSSDITIPEIYITANSVTTNAEATGQTKYIANSEVFSAIKTAIDSYLGGIKDKLPSYDWKISYEFEYIPFDYTTLNSWSTFINNSGVLGFTPAAEHGNPLWRIYAGNYELGKYILADGASKLLPFTAGHFGLLNADRLGSIYVAKSLGSEMKPYFIENNEEYELRAGEKLYIEYTPSTTTEDGTTQTQESVTEILTEGTIIKPSGFEGEGLIDSDVYKQSHTPHKSVTFEGTATPIEMYSLGANEQIAIRDFSRVTLNASKLSSPSVYVYKNFNDCPALESVSRDTSGKRINNSYTLKDGEYIFYTDHNQAELAYFTSGTEVTLTGNTVLSKRDIIDIATIFDSGIQDIPWELKTFTRGDSIIFQEFQYITIGPNDTLQSLVLIGDADYISSEWQPCDGVTYKTSGSDTPMSLPKINVADSSSAGNGWEVSSLLELSTSPSKAQALRSTGTLADDGTTTGILETSATLYKKSANGISGTSATSPITIAPADTEHPLSFKTNIACQSNGNEVDITNVYTNINDLRSFEFKILSDQTPAIVKTEKDSLVPYMDGATDIATWVVDNDKQITTKGYGELWTRVPLTHLVTEPDDTFDRALKLSVSVLPNTYGIFCVYVNYTANFTLDSTGTGITGTMTTDQDATTWIDFLPGTNTSDITLLNVDEATWESTNNYKRLMLNPGINCIRVDKTCDMFIKTSSESSTTSALYFDDLRLVDCSAVKYINADGEEVTQKTQGLNLAQIGYLAVVDDEPLNTFDLQIRKQLKEEAVDKAITLLDGYEATAKKNDLEAITAIKSEYDKLVKLVEFISNVKTELTAFNNIKDQTVKTELFNKYNELKADLTQEIALREALDDDKNTGEVTKQLYSLLESLNTVEANKQTLLAALDQLEQTASANAENFTKAKLSKGAILDDFESVATTTAYPQLISDLQLYNIKEVNAEYLRILSDIGAQVSNVANDDARKALLEAVEALNIAEYNKSITQIQTVLNVSKTAISDMLAAIQATAIGVLNSTTSTYEVDYASLLVQLVKLREYLTNAGLNEHISELLLISDGLMNNADKTTELLDVSQSLSTMLQSTDAPYGSYQTLVTTTDTLIDTAQTKINSNNSEYNPAITSAIKTLYQTLHTIYTGKLAAAISTLSTTLTDLKNKYTPSTSAINSDASASALLAKLNTYDDIRNSQLATINAFTTLSSYESLPYGTAAVLSVWPSYMKQDYLTGVAKLYKALVAVINGAQLTTIVLDQSFKTTANAARTTLVAQANIEAFQQLLNQINNYTELATQTTSRTVLINSLGNLIKPTNDLNAKLVQIKDDTSSVNRNKILCELITNWLATTDIADKQHLMTALKAELDSVISIDQQLVNISAKLICPSILLFPACNIANVESDAFYTRLTEYVEAQKTSLASSNSNDAFTYINDAYTVTNNLQTAIKDNTFEAFFTANDITVTDNSSTLLSKDYLTSLVELKNALALQEAVKDARSSTLLELLQNELVVAWQVQREFLDNTGLNKVPRSYWVDNNGNMYQKYIDGAWKTYPVNGTLIDINNWLTNGDWCITNDNKQIWRKASGKIVTVYAKRAYDSEDWLDATGNAIEIPVTNSNEDVLAVLTDLYSTVENLGQLNYLSDEARAANTTIALENQLLADISALDRNREFYYNVPVEANVAIDFNEGEAKLNTLMNPAINYDINNINNHFVISKIDINYLTNGLQIARSSKIR